MSLHSFREKVNLFIFSSKETVLGLFSVLSVLVVLTSIGTLIHYYGFPHDEKLKEIQLTILKSTFAFYVLNYIIRFFYTFEPQHFLKTTWFECTLVALIIFDAIGAVFSLTPIQSFFRGIGFNNYKDLYIIFLQVFLFIIILIQFAKASTVFSDIKLSPATLFLFSFILLIGAGTFLLWLPEMTFPDKKINFLQALFTSTSACCVTGLIVVDTAVVFTFKGKLILLFLIQFGGLSIISFATFFASFTSKGTGIKHQILMKDYFSTDSLMNAKGMLRQIISISILIEVVGTIIIYVLWDKSVPFKNDFEKFFYSLFHSVAAFNNAGFSMFSNGLSQSFVKNSFILHLAIGCLIFFGSLGFSAIRDLFSIEKMRLRMRLRWKKLSISTRIALYSSIMLILFGAVCFYFLEENNALSGQKTISATITSVFQSITCRTAGINTIDISILNQSTLIMMIFLMFIGASSGSTGGGIKTSTFSLILLSAYSTIRGKEQLEMYNHSISFDLLKKAFSILIFSLSFIFFGTLALAVTDPDKSVIRLAFEEVSAFSTVGLSTGITASMSFPGKIILILSMFIGRVGPLTLAFALSKKVSTTNYKYPDAHFMVG